jgi:hypothetical protein
MTGNDRPALPQCALTPSMVEAGVRELRERVFGEDLNLVVAAVYAAMDVARVSDSEALGPQPA